MPRLRDDVELELALHLTDDQIRVETIRPGQNEQLGGFDAEELLRQAVEPACLKSIFVSFKTRPGGRTVPVRLGLTKVGLPYQLVLRPWRSF
jgi:hypothetical protein